MPITRNKQPVVFSTALLLPALLWAVFFLLASCSGGGGLKPKGSGITPGNLKTSSLVTAQTRAQYQELSGTAIPFRLRKAPDDAGPPITEPALTGKGIMVSSGMHEQGKETLDFVLHLEKEHYADGYLEINTRDGKKEAWVIVGYDHLGSPEAAYDFTYLLQTPGGTLAYLVLIGGEYKEGEAAFVGYEGTLILPGKGNSLKNWEQAYKIDFGFRHPVPPVYQPMVNHAHSIFKGLPSKLSRLESKLHSLRRAQDKAAGYRNIPSGQELTPEQTAEMDQAHNTLAMNEQEAAAMIEEVETEFLGYFKLREDIADAYAAFYDSNLYRWQPLKEKRAYYDDWTVVEYHHPKIEKLIEEFIRLTNKPEPVMGARKAALQRVIQHNNWGKFPGANPRTEQSPTTASPEPVTNP